MRCPVDFVHLCVINVSPERLLDSFQVGLMLVRGDLWPSHDTKANLHGEVVCPPLAATTNQVGQTELGIRIDCNPGPCIAPASSFLFRCRILGLRSSIAKFRRTEFVLTGLPVSSDHGDGHTRIPCPQGA